jgi:hypothetical protein
MVKDWKLHWMSNMEAKLYDYLVSAKTYNFADQIRRVVGSAR